MSVHKTVEFLAGPEGTPLKPRFRHRNTRLLGVRGSRRAVLYSASNRPCRGQAIHGKPRTRPDIAKSTLW